MDDEHPLRRRLRVVATEIFRRSEGRRGARTPSGRIARSKALSSALTEYVGSTLAEGSSSYPLPSRMATVRLVEQARIASSLTAHAV